jgi:DNA helicase-2/ATP-dependent DNA helicase PcrA
MPINNSDILIEEKKFIETKDWIIDQLENTKEKVNEYEARILLLKKSSRGAYDQDLILTEQIFDFANKSLTKYDEAQHNPYFARIDFRERRRDVESFYIGKHGLNDHNKNEEIVIDWRAPVANLYYSGTFGEAFYTSPMGVIDGELTLKRKFLIKNGTLEKIYDEGVNEIILKTSEEGDELIDEFLKVNLEQNMNKKLKEVVSTIQKEQNEIIRAFKNKPIIIQGSAGSGKTTVALHRLAYLIYTYSQDSENQNILVVAPNKLFLEYISEVLPNLGVHNVKQNTYEELCQEILKDRNRVITKDEKLSKIIEDSNEDQYVKLMINSSKFKGSLLFKSILARYIKYIEAIDSDVTDIMVEGYTLFSSKEIKKLYIRNLSHLSIVKRKEEINKYLKLRLKEKLIELSSSIDSEYNYKIMDIKSMNSLSDKEKREMIVKTYDERDFRKKNLNLNSNKAIKEFFKMWQKIDFYKYYIELFTNEELFNKLTEGKIPKQLYEFMKDEIEINKNKKLIDSDDLSALVYLKLKLEGIDNGNFMHMVVDEAQDYSYFQLYILDEISKNHSMTIVGDLGQGIYNYKGINSWNKVIDLVFKSDATYITLSQSYRSTVEIIDFANRVLVKQNLNISPATPVLRHGEKPRTVNIEYNEVEKIDGIIKEVLDKRKSTVALICKTHGECIKIYNKLRENSIYTWSLIDENVNNIREDYLIIPSYMTKGLEFDATIIYNCDDDNYKDCDLDKKLLYVALTRALHLQYVTYKTTLTKLLE